MPELVLFSSCTIWHCYLCCWKADKTRKNFGVTPALPETDDPGYADALNAELQTVVKLMHDEAQAQ